MLPQTTAAKAWSALPASIFGIVAVLQQTGVIHIAPELTTAIGGILSALTPLIVYYVPNKAK